MDARLTIPTAPKRTYEVVYGQFRDNLFQVCCPNFERLKDDSDFWSERQSFEQALHVYLREWLMGEL